MPKVSEEYREARRAEIADAAVRTFSAKGFQRTSMADIIAESGLSAGAIYGHYASKQEIMLAVATRILRNRTGEVEALGEREQLPDPGEVLGMMMRGLSNDVSDTRILLQVWTETLVDPQMKALMLEVVGMIGSTYRRYLLLWATRSLGKTEAEAEAWASGMLPVILGLGQGYIVQRAIFDGFDGEQYLMSAQELLAR